MKINSFNECSCGNLIETNEPCCDECYTFDMIEVNSTDTFLDELFLEDQLDSNGNVNVDGVNLIRKYDDKGRII